MKTFAQLCGRPDWFNVYTQVNFGGGGGTTASKTGSTTTAGLTSPRTPLDPGLTQREADAKNATSNAVGTVANTGVTAIREAQDVGRSAVAGEGIFGQADTTGLKTAATRAAQQAFAPVQDKIAGSGLVGGSRSGIVAGERDAALAGELAGIDYQAGQEARKNAMWGAQALGEGGAAEAGTTLSNLTGLMNLGGVQRDIAQEQADADAMALERYANIFQGTVGSQQSSTTTQKGGK